MTYRKRNFLIILATCAVALIIGAIMFSACGKKEKHDDGKEESAAQGVITIIDDGSLGGVTYSLAVGENVYSFMQDKIPEKDHAEFDHWEYEGNSLGTGLLMTESVALTAVYKTEITLEIYAKNIVGYEEWQDEGDYTHIDWLDIVFYDLAGTEYSSGAVESFVSETIGDVSVTPESGKNVGFTVDSDYTKNVIKLYYERGSVNVRFGTNYPDDSGKTDEEWRVYTYFGYPVALSSEYECDGYLMLGWSSTQRATSPEYAVDCVSSRLLVWNSERNVYELADEDSETVFFYPEHTMSLYITWTKGYSDMFGSTDTIFVLGDDTENVYLYRGGFFIESARKIGDEYYFTNYSDGTDGYYSVKLSDNYVFAYWEERFPGYYYRYEYSYEDGVFSGKVSESEYVNFSYYDEVAYVSSGDRSVGTYRVNDDGTYTITFTSGQLTGEVKTIALGEAQSGTSSTKIFMFRNDDEADMGRLALGVATYAEGSGTYATYYYTDYYYLQLDGFGDCLYYVASSSAAYVYTYKYWLEEDVLYLFGYYTYSYAGQFKYLGCDVADSDGYQAYAWFQYYEEYDGTFDVYGKENGGKLGQVTCDGYMNAYFKDTDGNQTWSGRFSLESFMSGYAMYIGGTGAEDNAEYSRFEIVENTTGEYELVLLPSTYMELYRFTSSGLGYDMLILDSDGAGTAKYVVLGYDWYGDGYYFTVLEGSYKKYYNDDYDLTYYVFTVDGDKTYDWTDDFELYVAYYYSSLEISVYPTITSFAFTIYEYNSSYYTNIWLWYDIAGNEENEFEEIDDVDNGNGDAGNAAPWIAEGSVSYIEECEGENFVLTFDYDVYEMDVYGRITSGSVESGSFDYEGSFKFLITDAGVVYGVLTLSDDLGGEALSLVGSVYGWLEVQSGGEEEPYTATCLYFDMDFYAYDGETYDFYAITMYSYVYIKESEEAVEQVTYIPVYIYGASIEDGDVNVGDDAYLMYNGLGGYEDGEFTYFDGTTSYEGKVTRDAEASQNSFGHTVYTFTSNNDGETVVSFILLYSSTKTVFVEYDSSKELEKFGANGETLEIDAAGFEAIYTDSRGNMYTATYANFTVGYGEEGEIEYIQLIVGNYLITLDFDVKESGYDFVTVGWELGGYYIVDYFMRQYIAVLDGQGKVTIYELEPDETGKLVECGEGTYTLTDTIIEMTYTIYEDNQNLGVGETHTASGEVDIEEIIMDGNFSYMSFGSIYFNEEDFTGTYVDATDMSILTLYSDGTAERYATDGSYEKGKFTWLDEEYFHYESEDGSFDSIYMKRDGFNILRRDYSTSAAKYYSSDMTKSFEFTAGGVAIFGDVECYYTVGDNLDVKIYYVSEDATTEKNIFGYAVYDQFGKIGETFGSSNGTYYNIYVDGAFVLKRKDGESEKYNYTITSTTYQLGQLTLSATGATADNLSGSIIYYDESDSNNQNAYLEIVNGDDGNRAVELVLPTYRRGLVVYPYIYYDYEYFRYGVEIDLSTRTYSITSEEFYLPIYLDAYLYYTYYGYLVADYYFSYLELVWNIDENGEATTQTASGWILPYLVGDSEEGGSWTALFGRITGTEFTTKEIDDVTHFYMELEGSDGNQYELEFVIDYYYIYNAYYQYNSFYVVNLWSPIEGTSTSSSDGESYSFRVGYEVYSDYYSMSSPHVELAITSGSEGDETTEIVNILSSFILDGCVFSLESGFDEEGQIVSSYWKMTFAENDGTYEVEVSVATEFSTYALEDGSGFIDVYTNGSGEEQIVWVYIAEDNTYYFAITCEKGEDETYTVELADGYTYTITLEESGDTLTGKIERIEG